ncbi:hypothetical protein CLOP_g19277 [Closterium sp. NIES-67]|nr:hypothetical protein CLOP_g19277 [Closterium sp. NIES-67]
MGASTSTFASPGDTKDAVDSEASPEATPSELARVSSPSRHDADRVVNSAACSLDDASLSNQADGPCRKRTTIDSLPEEVLVKVLAAVSSTAENPAEVVSPSMTCRRWKRASQDRDVLCSTSRGGVAVRARQWSIGAFIFLRRLSENGCLEACFMLAMILFYCIPEAQFEGGRLLMHSARQGHAASLHAASILSFNGSGLGQQHKDVKVGVALCARAAALGHTEAMRELGHCLLDGYGVRQDVQEGWRMLLEAQAAELSPINSPHLSALASLIASAKRKSDVDSSVAAKRPRSLDSFGNVAAVGCAEQEAAVQALLGVESKGAFTKHGMPVSPGGGANFKPPSVFRVDASACGPSVTLAPKKAAAPAAAAWTSPLEATKFARPARQVRQARRQARMPSQELQDSQSQHLEGKTAVMLKLLAALKAGSFKLTAESIAKLQPILSSVQTSLLPSAAHPAHVFVKDWFAVRAAKECGKSAACSDLGSAKDMAALGLDAMGEATLGVCNRESCGRPEKRALEFWRCSTCWSARYCSRSCQLHDWHARHGAECCAQFSVAGGAAAFVAAGISADAGGVRLAS